MSYPQAWVEKITLGEHFLLKVCRQFFSVSVLSIHSVQSQSQIWYCKILIFCHCQIIYTDLSSRTYLVRQQHDSWDQISCQFFTNEFQRNLENICSYASNFLLLQNDSMLFVLQQLQVETKTAALTIYLSLRGRNNVILFLSLSLVLPRKNIMYDVMTYLKSGVASSRLIHEIPHLTIAKPITQKNQLDLIQAISNEARWFNFHYFYVRYHWFLWCCVICIIF